MKLCISSFALFSIIAVSIVSWGGEPVMIPTKVAGPVHDPANHTYWYGPFCECASVADIDGDGDLDLTSGRDWYEAPEWTKHADFRDGAETNGPETDDNSEFAMDVNRDGRMDIVSSGWMRMKGAFWYENPGRSGVKAGLGASGAQATRRARQPLATSARARLSDEKSSLLRRVRRCCC